MTPRLKPEPLGPLFLAAPMVVFGGDHFAFADSISTIIPAWIPWHMFWTYFVGACLLAGGVALAVRRRETLVLALFGTMMLLFVVLMHIAEVAHAPGDRFAWGVLSRDGPFGACVLSLVLTRAPDGRDRWRPVLTAFRLAVGVAVVFWAVEDALHPAYRPGIPLRQVMPEWMPLQAPLAWLTAACLLVAGLGLLAGRDTRRWAILLAVVFLALTVLGIPITLAAPTDIGGINYVMDNLMTSGCALCLAAAATRPAEAARHTAD